VTVIAAMWDTDGSILIGADSKAVDPTTGISYTVEKLKAHPSSVLVWGTSGALSIGERFSEWLTAHDVAHSSWQELEGEIRKKVCDLNGNERHLVRSSESEPDIGDAIRVLCAGYLNGAAKLFAVNDKGNCAITDAAGKPEAIARFEAIGGSAQARYIMLGIDYMLAYFAHFGVSAPFEGLPKMQLLFDAITTRIEGCGPPMHIWRVGEKGIDKPMP